MLPQRVPIFRRHFGRRLELAGGQVRPHAFAHAPGMHAVKQVPPHQAVAAPAENVQSGTARHQQPHPTAVGVEETLQQRLPLPVLVELVEDRDGQPRPQPVQLQHLRQRRRTTQELPPVIGVVPVEISVTEGAAGGGLTDLAGTRDQGHLAMPLEMVVQDGGVDARAFSHEANVVQIAKWSRPFYEGRDKGALADGEFLPWLPLGPGLTQPFLGHKVPTVNAREIIREIETFPRALDAVLGVSHRDLVNTAELIYERSKALPAKAQVQVLDFVEFLGQREKPSQDEWTALSLAAAFRGMEEEQWPAYADTDLVEQLILRPQDCEPRA